MDGIFLCRPGAPTGFPDPSQSRAGGLGRTGLAGAPLKLDWPGGLSHPTARTPQAGAPSGQSTLELVHGPGGCRGTFPRPLARLVTPPPLTPPPPDRLKAAPQRSWTGRAPPPPPQGLPSGTSPPGPSRPVHLAAGPPTPWVGRQGGSTRGSHPLGVVLLSATPRVSHKK